MKIDFGGDICFTLEMQPKGDAGEDSTTKCTKKQHKGHQDLINGRQLSLCPSRSVRISHGRTLCSHMFCIDNNSTKMYSLRLNASGKFAESRYGDTTRKSIGDCSRWILNRGRHKFPILQFESHFFYRGIRAIDRILVLTKQVYPYRINMIPSTTVDLAYLIRPIVLKVPATGIIINHDGILKPIIG